MEKTTTTPVSDFAQAFALALEGHADKAVQILLPLSQSHPTYAKDFMAALAAYKPEQLHLIQTRLLVAIDAIAAHCPTVLAFSIFSINPGKKVGAERLNELRGRIPYTLQALPTMPALMDVAFSMQPAAPDASWFNAICTAVERWNPTPAQVKRVFDTLGKAPQAQRPRCYAKFAAAFSGVIDGQQWAIVIQEVLKDDPHGDNPEIWTLTTFTLNRAEVSRLLNPATKKAILLYLLSDSKLHRNLVSLLSSGAKWDFLDLLYPLSTAAVPIQRCFAVPGFTRELVTMLLEVYDHTIPMENAVADVIQSLMFLRGCPSHAVAEIGRVLFDKKHAVAGNWSLLVSLALDVGQGAMEEYAFVTLVFGVISLGGLEAADLLNVCKALLDRQTSPIARIKVLTRLAGDCANAAAAQGAAISNGVPDWVWTTLLKDFATVLKEVDPPYRQREQLLEVVAMVFGSRPRRPPLPAARQQEFLQVIITAGKVDYTLAYMHSHEDAWHNGLFKLLIQAQPQAASQLGEYSLRMCFANLAWTFPELLYELKSLDHLVPADRQLALVTDLLADNCTQCYSNVGVWKFVQGLQLAPAIQPIKQVALQLSMQEGKLGNWCPLDLQPNVILPAESGFVPVSWLKCLNLALRDPKTLKDGDKPKLVSVCKDAILNAMTHGQLDWAVVKEVVDFHHALATQHPQIDWKTVHQGDPFALLKPSVWKPVRNALLTWLDGVRELAFVHIDALEGPQDDNTKKIVATFEQHFHGLVMLITGGKNAAINAWKPTDQGGRQHLFDLAFGGPTGQLVIDLPLLEAVFHSEAGKPVCTVTQAVGDHIAALVGTPLRALAQQAALHRLKAAHDALVAVVATKAFPTQRDALRLRLRTPSVNTSPELEAVVVPWIDATYECLMAVFNAYIQGKRSDRSDLFFKEALRPMLTLLCPSQKAFIEKWVAGPDGSLRPLAVLMLGAHDLFDASTLKTILHWQGDHPVAINPTLEDLIKDLFMLPAVVLGPAVDAAQKKLNACHLALRKFTVAHQSNLAHECADFLMHDVTIIGKFGALSTKPWDRADSVHWMVGPTVLVGVTTPEGEFLAWAWCALLQVPNQPGITLSVEDIHIEYRKWRLSTVSDVTPAGKRVLDVLIAAIPGIAKRLGATNAILCNSTGHTSEIRGWLRNRTMTHPIPAQLQILAPSFLGDAMRLTLYGGREKYEALE